MVAAALLAVATLAPAASAGAAPRPAATAPSAAPAVGTSPRATFVGAGVGAVSAFGTGSSVLVQLDYGVLRRAPLARRLELEWHLLAAFARPAGDETLTAQVVPPLAGAPVAVNAGTEEVTALLFEVIPTARALWTPVQGVSFFGDAGLGLVQTVERYERTEMYLGHSTRREYATGLVLRLGAGLALDVAPRWRVLFEPFAVDLMLGPKFSAWTPTLGVAFRL